MARQMELCGWFVPDTLSFELVKGLPVFVATLAIGGLAALIAWRQWKVAQAKLKLDLFEKRYVIFLATWGELSHVVNSDISFQRSGELDNLRPQAQFLFGDEIFTYLTVISKNEIQVGIIAAKSRSNGNIMPPEDIANYLELMTWFFQEASEGCRVKFARYLDFSSWH